MALSLIGSVRYDNTLYLRGPENSPDDSLEYSYDDSYASLYAK